MGTLSRQRRLLTEELGKAIRDENEEKFRQVSQPFETGLWREDLDTFSELVAGAKTERQFEMIMQIVNHEGTQRKAKSEEVLRSLAYHSWGVGNLLLSEMAIDHLRMKRVKGVLSLPPLHESADEKEAERIVNKWPAASAGAFESYAYALISSKEENAKRKPAGELAAMTAIKLGDSKKVYLLCIEPGWRATSNNDWAPKAWSVLTELKKKLRAGTALWTMAVERDVTPLELIIRTFTKESLTHGYDCLGDSFWRLGAGKIQRRCEMSSQNMIELAKVENVPDWLRASIIKQGLMQNSKTWEEMKTFVEQARGLAFGLNALSLIPDREARKVSQVSIRNFDDFTDIQSATKWDEAWKSMDNLFRHTNLIAGACLLTNQEPEFVPKKVLELEETRTIIDFVVSNAATHESGAVAKQRNKQRI